MYIERHLKSAFEAAADFFPALLLTGPRQVGKTTFLRTIADSSRKYVTFDDIGLRILAKEDPRSFLERYSPPVLIDEIQYVPELLSYIKLAIDEQRFCDKEHSHGMFWLTGSQRFSLMSNVSESLAGRVGIFDMPGISQSELADRPNIPFTPEREFSGKPQPGIMKLFERIWQGCYPEVIAASNAQHDLFYSSYVSTYLERDIRNLTTIQDLDRFYKFICSCAARTGQLLNISELSRDASIDSTTARNWLTILEASQIIYLLPPFVSSLTTRLVKTPKLYFLDTGLCAYLTHWQTPESLESGAMSGAIFETWCISEIIKTYWNAGKNTSNLFFYRDRDMQEIDLLIEDADGYWPIECKKSSTPRANDARHFKVMNNFGKAVKRGALLCTCPEVIPLPKLNTLAIPASEI